MQVLKVPSRLRMACALMTLSIPLAAFQTVVVSRAPWWKLPYQQIQIWSLGVGLVCLPLAYATSRGKKWAFHALSVFAGLWTALSAWTAIRLADPSIGFYTVFLGAFWVSVLSWAKHEMGRSFFDPHMEWYQGLPEAIPGLQCEIRQKDSAKRLRVSRLDGDGAFVFTDAESRFDVSRDQELELVFSFKGRQARCSGFPVRKLEHSRGVGIQFREMAPDQRKDLGDFVEQLRGEGYV